MANEDIGEVTRFLLISRNTYRIAPEGYSTAGLYVTRNSAPPHLLYVQEGDLIKIVSELREGQVRYTFPKNYTVHTDLKDLENFAEEN